MRIADVNRRRARLRGNPALYTRCIIALNFLRPSRAAPVIPKPWLRTSVLSRTCRFSLEEAEVRRPNEQDALVRRNHCLEFGRFVGCVLRRMSSRGWIRRLDAGEPALSGTERSAVPLPRPTTPASRHRGVSPEDAQRAPNRSGATFRSRVKGCAAAVGVSCSSRRTRRRTVALSRHDASVPAAKACFSGRRPCVKLRGHTEETDS